jgi:hypothetical protein
MTSWSPYRLPRLRDMMVATHEQFVADMPTIKRQAEQQGISDGFDPQAEEWMCREVRHLRAAELYWATEPMSALALDASGDLPEWTPAAARPCGVGLLVWEGGLPDLRWQGAPERAWTVNALRVRVAPTVRVDGVLWAPDPEGLRLSLLTRPDLIAEWLMPRWHQVGLFPFGEVKLALNSPVPTTSQDFSSGLVAALGATWLLMQQPTVASRSTLDEPRAGKGRAPRPERAVRIIDLRAARGGDDPDREADGARNYRHRWMVRGHWRQQACGPQRSHRRPTWVPPHVKGPDGAPWLTSERVHVWRR